MKYVRQVLIILLISLIGEVMNYFIPLSIPASIYGMVLMFFLLVLGVVKIDHVKAVGIFLLDILPLLFIPSAVGIISEIEQIETIWFQVVIITIVTTVITMSVTGVSTQIIIRHKRRKRDDNNDIYQ